jgi:hypothetical protein
MENKDIEETPCFESFEGQSDPNLTHYMMTNIVGQKATIVEKADEKAMKNLKVSCLEICKKYNANCKISNCLKVEFIPVSGQEEPKIIDNTVINFYI